MLNIGFIGAGGIARDRHLPNLLKLPGIKLAGVANRTRESGEQAAAAFGFARVYGSWQELTDDPSIDAVFICTQPYMHREMTVWALEKGKHVFCQARMAMDADDGEQMLQADRHTRLTTMLCPAPLYMTVAPFVRNWLAEGKLGTVRHVVLEHAGSMLLNPLKPLLWRQRADLQGINKLDIGMTAEVMNEWFGPTVQLSALAKTWVDERPADKDGRTRVELPDSVTVIGEFESGATLTALYTGAVEGGEQRMTIHGDKGTMTCYPNEPFVRVNDGRGETIIDIPAAQRGRWQVEEEFVQAVKEGRKGSPSFEDGVRYMRFSQAVHDSIKSGGVPIRLRTAINGNKGTQNQ